MAVRALGIEPMTVAGELRTWSERVQDTNNEKFIEGRNPPVGAPVL
jgi:hypothetical protein